MDICLHFDQEAGLFDLLLSEPPADLQGDEDLLTAVIISLFTDARAHDDDPPQVVPQGQDPVVAEQYHRLVGQLQGVGLVRGAFEQRVGQCRIGVALRGIEHPEAEADGQQARETLVDLPFVDQPPLHGLGQVREDVPAVEVYGVDHGIGRSRRGVGMRAVVAEEVVDRPAVGGDVSREVPVSAQDLFQQQVAGAARLPAEAVVGPHDGAHAPLDDQFAEGREIGVPEVIVAHLGIEDVARAVEPFFTTLGDEERSGMGFTIMQTFMTTFKVESKLGGGTTVTMTKRFAAGSETERDGLADAQ